MTKTYGPNVTKLILKFASVKAIPTGGGIADGIKFFTDQALRHKILAEAETEAITALDLIKFAPDNPYGTDNEVIAGILLDRIERKSHELKL